MEEDSKEPTSEMQGLPVVRQATEYSPHPSCRWAGLQLSHAWSEHNLPPFPSLFCTNAPFDARLTSHSKSNHTRLGRIAWG